jgi:hypothetical protein
MATASSEAASWNTSTSAVVLLVELLERVELVIEVELAAGASVEELVEETPSGSVAATSQLTRATKGIPELVLFAAVPSVSLNWRRTPCRRTNQSLSERTRGSGGHKANSRK